jgi:hypothetical protein
VEEKESLWKKITKLFIKYSRKEIENFIKSRDQYKKMYEENIITLAKLCEDSRYIVGMVKDLHDIKFHIDSGKSTSLDSTGSSGFSFYIGLRILEDNFQAIKEYLTTILKSEETMIVQDYSVPENTTTNLINLLLKNIIDEYSKIKIVK